MTMNSPELAAQDAAIWEHEDADYERMWPEAVIAALTNPDSTHLLNSLNALEHGAPTPELSRVLAAMQTYVRRVDQEAM